MPAGDDDFPLVDERDADLEQRNGVQDRIGRLAGRDDRQNHRPGEGSSTTRPPTRPRLALVDSTSTAAPSRTSAPNSSSTATTIKAYGSVH